MIMIISNYNINKKKQKTLKSNDDTNTPPHPKNNLKIPSFGEFIFFK